jgi:hypothetical protein
MLYKYGVSLEISKPVALLISRLIEESSCRSRVLVNASLGRCEIADALNEILLKHPRSDAAMFAEVGLISLIGIKPDPIVVSELKAAEYLAPVVISARQGEVHAKCVFKDTLMTVIGEI